MKSVLITYHFRDDPPDVRRYGIVDCENDIELALLGSLLGRISKAGGFTVKGVSLDTEETEVQSTYDFVGFRVLFD